VTNKCTLWPRRYDWSC